jgi:hypothetical protein
MLDLRRSLRAAATAALAAAGVAMPALAQQAQPAQPSQPADTVGPPVLKDFQLPGQRTTPPAAQPQPQPRPPAAERPAERPATPAQQRPAPHIAPTPATPAGTPRATRPAPAPAPGTDAPTPAPGPQSAGAQNQAAPAAPDAGLAPPVAIEPAAPSAAAPTPEPAPAEESGSSPGLGWLWPALALLAAGAMLLGWLRLRRRPRREEEPEPGVLEEAVATAPAPAPVPEPEPVPVAPAFSERRAWLEVDIKAERAAATDREAIVDYELLIDNVGAETARNIRIDARLFNAGAEGDIAAFFQGPIHAESGSPHVTVPPGRGLKLAGKVALPMTEVNAVEIQGRRLFIPMVAINVAYDWGEAGAGRTSRSWLVGREGEGQSAKMGAFRLDLGPRIYRSVGQREAALVKV